MFSRTHSHIYDQDDNLNRNDCSHRLSSDEDNLATIGRKVSELKNCNMFADISMENGNVATELDEVLRINCSNTCIGQDSTEDACNDSFTDEEGEVYNNYLRRRR